MMAHAGPDDKWRVLLQTCDPNENAGAPFVQLGTYTTPSWAYLSTTYPTTIYCTDHSLDKRWYTDIRLPMANGETRTWHLTLTAAPDYPYSTIVLNGWNPSGAAYDLDGPVSVKLVYADNPSSELWTFSPDANGSSQDPAYSTTLNWTGEPIRLDLIASAGEPPVSSIGWARNYQVGQPVSFKGAVVTSIASSDANAPGLWLQSPDGSSAIRVPAAWSVSIGSRVDCTGTVTWADGIPILSSPQLKSQSPGSPARGRFMNQRTLACDPTESLNYTGQNPVGLLVTACGKVTAVDTTQCLFYIDDGTNLQDGSGNVGLRVTCPQGTTLPNVGVRRRVTGIRTIIKSPLAADAVVNGVLRSAWETLYIPVLATRDSADIIPL